MSVFMTEERGSFSVSTEKRECPVAAGAASRDEDDDQANHGANSSPYGLFSFRTIMFEALSLDPHLFVPPKEVQTALNAVLMDILCLSSAPLFLLGRLFHRSPVPSARQPRRFRVVTHLRGYVQPVCQIASSESASPAYLPPFLQWLSSTCIDSSSEATSCCNTGICAICRSAVWRCVQSRLHLPTVGSSRSSAVPPPSNTCATCAAFWSAVEALVAARLISVCVSRTGTRPIPSLCGNSACTALNRREMIFLRSAAMHSSVETAPSELLADACLLLRKDELVDLYPIVVDAAGRTARNTMVCGVARMLNATLGSRSRTASVPNPRLGDSCVRRPSRSSLSSLPLSAARPAVTRSRSAGGSAGNTRSKSQRSLAVATADASLTKPQLIHALVSACSCLRHRSKSNDKDGGITRPVRALSCDECSTMQQAALDVVLEALGPLISVNSEAVRVCLLLHSLWAVGHEQVTDDHRSLKDVLAPSLLASVATSRIILPPLHRSPPCPSPQSLLALTTLAVDCFRKFTNAGGDGAAANVDSLDLSTPCSPDRPPRCRPFANIDQLEAYIVCSRLLSCLIALSEGRHKVEPGTLGRIVGEGVLPLALQCADAWLRNSTALPDDSFLVDAYKTLSQCTNITVPQTRRSGLRRREACSRLCCRSSQLLRFVRSPTDCNSCLVESCRKGIDVVSAIECLCFSRWAQSIVEERSPHNNMCAEFDKLDDLLRTVDDVVLSSSALFESIADTFYLSKQNRMGDSVYHTKMRDSTALAEIEHKVEPPTSVFNLSSTDDDIAEISPTDIGKENRVSALRTDPQAGEDSDSDVCFLMRKTRQTVANGHKLTSGPALPCTRVLSRPFSSSVPAVNSQAVASKTRKKVSPQATLTVAPLSPFCQCCSILDRDNVHLPCTRSTDSSSCTSNLCLFDLRFRCSALYMLCRCVVVASELCEKAHLYLLACSLLMVLLRFPTFRPQRSGAYWNRLAIDLMHLKEGDAAVACCGAALSEFLGLLRNVARRGDILEAEKRLTRLTSLIYTPSVNYSLNSSICALLGSHGERAPSFRHCYSSCSAQYFAAIYAYAAKPFERCFAVEDCLDVRLRDPLLGVAYIKGPSKHALKGYERSLVIKSFAATKGSNSLQFCGKFSVTFHGFPLVPELLVSCVRQKARGWITDPAEDDPECVVNVDFVEMRSGTRRSSTSVEQVALRHLCKAWDCDGRHSEGSMMRSLFILVFREEVFDTSVCEGAAFPSVVSLAPLDIASPGFFTRRHVALNAKLSFIAGMDKESFLDYVRHQHGVLKTSTVFGMDDLSTEEAFEPIMGLSNEIPMSVLVGIFRIAIRGGFGFGGFPDLTVWGGCLSTRLGEEGGAFWKPGVLFAEVKGPGDSLSDTQRVWLSELAAISGAAAIVRVLAVD